MCLHGSFHGSWCWSPLLRLIPPAWGPCAPTLPTTKTDRSPADRDTQVDALAALLKQADRTCPLVLLAHSFAGMLIADALAQAGRTPRAIIFLDAFLPTSGQSAFDLLGPAAAPLAASAHDGWMQPPPPQLFGIDDPALARWTAKQLSPMPLATHEGKSRADTQTACQGIATYIRCKQFPGFSGEREKAARWDWPVHDLDCGHDAMVAAPQQLATLLVSLLAPCARKVGDAPSA